MNRLVTALAMVLVLGAGATVPVQAQSFGIFFGDEPSDFEQEYLICLTDNQIRQAVADRGYSDIALNVANGKKVQVRASKGGWVYLLDFNFCTGRIESRQQLRPAH
jgi:hypothetical protein